MDGPNNLGGRRSSSSTGRLKKFNPNNTPQNAGPAGGQATGQPTSSAGAASASSRVRAGEFSGRTGQSSFDKQKSFDPNAPAGSGGRAQSYINNRRNPQAPMSDMSTNTNNHANEFNGAHTFSPSRGEENDIPKKTKVGTPKYIAPHLHYPSDVGAEPGMGNQGHYVMFTMNEIKNSEIMPATSGYQADEFDLSNGALLNEAKKTNPTFTKKQLDYFAKYDQALTDAGKLAQKRGDVLKERDAAFGGLGAEYATGKVTKSDLDAVGAKKLFKEFAQSYKIVETYDEISQQLILGSGEFMNRYFQEEQAQSNYHVGDKRTNVIKRKETVRVAGSITLYMPPQVVTTSTAEYTDTEVGTGAAMAVAFLDRFGVSGMGGVGENLTKTLQQSTPEIKEALSNIGMKSIGMMPGFQGAAAIRDMKRGFIRAPKMELAFKGIGKRSFQFDFKMIPKSREEAETVRRIVKTFRAGMLPEFLKGTDRSSRFFKMPNTFDIQYLYNATENQYLHKISTCVCKSVAVTYGGGGRYQTFEANEKGAPPVETNIALQFEELELITKERVMEGF